MFQKTLHNMVLIGAFVALTLTVSEVLSLQVCGKNLADMLDLVCDGRGFHWTAGDSKYILDVLREKGLLRTLI